MSFPADPSRADLSRHRHREPFQIGFQGDSRMAHKRALSTHQALSCPTCFGGLSKQFSGRKPGDWRVALRDGIDGEEAIPERHHLLDDSADVEIPIGSRMCVAKVNLQIGHVKRTDVEGTRVIPIDAVG